MLQDILNQARALHEAIGKAQEQSRTADVADELADAYSEMDDVIKSLNIAIRNEGYADRDAQRDLVTSRHAG